REEGLDVPQEEFDVAFYGATDTLEGTISRKAGFGETVDRVADGLAERLGRETSVLRKIGGRFPADSRRQLAESAALLARLRQRHAIGIVSNFYGNLQAVLDETNLSPSVGAAIDSTLIGCKKPDRRIFQAALDALGASAPDAVFVGDSAK